MKKAIAMLLSVAMTATLAVGGTLAYLTDTDEDVNVMTLGQVHIDQLEYERVDVESENDDATVREFHDNKPLYPAVTEDGFDYTPGDSYVDWDQIGKNDYTSEIWDPSKINNEVDKMVFVKNKGDWDAYVRTVFGFEANGFTEAEFRKLFHMNLNDENFIWEWKGIQTINDTNYFIVTATYKDILAPGALTPISLSQIALDSKATNEDVAGFGDTYQILVQSQAVQAAGFADAPTALNEAFGTIPTTGGEYPFVDDAATKGTDVFTAVNYLNGGTEQITKKVTNITFGLTSEYSDIALQNKGTLVDVGQDVPVNAYYVPNGSNYDVYLLASDTIYAPVDCSNLCNGMSNLLSFDTSNLDFSRTTSMYRMLRDCAKLSQIDTSDWDTSNVTNMRDLFRGCKSIPALDVSGWETGKVTTMVATFQDCVKLTELDLNDWDVSKVTEAIQMFNRCAALETLEISNWKPKSLSNATTMFQSCSALKELDLSGWTTPSLTLCSGTFNHCESITKLDVSTWDVSNVTDFGLMFQACYVLEELDLSKWNVSNKAANLNSMFFEDFKLKELAVGSWDVSGVTDFNQVFVRCHALERIDGLGKWVTSSGVKFGNLFNDCQSLKVLDLSNFDTTKATDLAGFFTSLKSIEEIRLGENFSFNGNGTISLHMPAPAAVEGGDGKWYNLETGVGYAYNQVPQGAATYVAVMP